MKMAERSCAESWQGAFDWEQVARPVRGRGRQIASAAWQGAREIARIPSRAVSAFCYSSDSRYQRFSLSDGPAAHGSA
jgi:hypothetical protein